MVDCHDINVFQNKELSESSHCSRNTMESSAASVLKRAVDMDKKEQYTTALVLYQEGVQILLDAVKGIMKNSFIIFFIFLG